MISSTKIIDSFVFLFLFCLIIGLLWTSGNLSDTGPRIVDDNQIYKLHTEINHKGFVGTLNDHLDSRIENYNRFVPLFLVHKVTEVHLFEKNIIIWRLYSGLIGVLTAFFLYLFARTLKFNCLESMGFAIFTMLGAQSVTFWKLIQGEGIGMMILSVSLLFMARSVYSNSNKTQLVYTVLHVVFAIAASLSKESFILILPAMVLCRIWLVNISNQESIKESILFCLPASIILIVVCIAELILIKYGIGKTTFGYAGWEGFNFTPILLALSQLIELNDLGLVLLATIFVTSPLIITKNFSNAFKAQRISFVFPILLFVLIVVPQLLLYSKSGFISSPKTLHVHPERYLYPAIFGFSFLILILFRLARPVHIKNSTNEDSELNGFPFFTLKNILLFFILLAFLSAKTWGVNFRATAYAEESRMLNKWFHSIAEHTAPSDRIVIFYNQRNNDAIRLKFILENGFDRKNLIFMPNFGTVPFSDVKSVCEKLSGYELLKKCRIREDLRAHLHTMHGLESMNELKLTDTFIFLNVMPGLYHQTEVEKHFFSDKRSATILRNHKRHESSLGYVSYYTNKSETNIPQE
ncbi:hypothetical protein [Oceanicoccus sagamiensis]|uniref:Glycosyltransferase RgtA/B/C/D-like domain-containing protein n=1 Tax=Oceanicoccus sagamiensis TaxID=716816 RepID=A0A1X9N9W9_9GAMM|nr:hypothetical protein [Oceanicoccus sagamiensis]ARN73874.1 hypothetical protein BST96_06955 [Oceanicoccus sagamiensis]